MTAQWSNYSQSLNQWSKQILSDESNGWSILQAIIGRSWQKKLSTLSAFHHVKLVYYFSEEA